MQDLRDKIERDHDKVIKIESDVNLICKTLNRIENKIDKQREEFDKKFTKDTDDCKECKDDLITKINESTTKSLSWSNFAYIFGPVVSILFAGFFYLSGLVYANTTSINNLAVDVKNHNSYAVVLFEEVFDIKWGIIDNESINDARILYKEMKHPKTKEH